MGEIFRLDRNRREDVMGPEGRHIPHRADPVGPGPVQLAAATFQLSAPSTSRSLSHFKEVSSD